MLKYRLVFGPIMIAALLAVLYVDDWLDQVNLDGTIWQDLFLGRTYLPAGLPMLALILVIIALASRELCRIFWAENVQASPFMVGLSGIIGCVLVYIIPYRMDSQQTIAIYASFMVGIFVMSLIRHSYVAQRTDGAVTVAAVTMFALIYIGAMPGFFLAIRRWHSAWVVAAVILITKACDIGAYAAGRLFGRRKLIPWLSPGKTWEGLLGGVVFSCALAMGLAALSNATQWFGQWEGSGELRQFEPTRIPLWYALICGVVFALVGVVGDLTASLFKRDAGIKDSGQSIPGFGGVLDVVDSPILVAPFAYWMITALGTITGVD